MSGKISRSASAARGKSACVAASSRRSASSATALRPIARIRLTTSSAASAELA